MASQSDSPPNSVDNKPQNPVVESVQQSPEEHQMSKPEAAMEKSSASVFVNSEPIREDQVQNAVKFLSHPKVRGSPVMYRRSFLERKGLTKEEIDEAFRRVPDPTPAISSTQTTAASQGQLKTSSNIQPQALVQSTQPVPGVGSMTKVGYFSRFHWSHAVAVVGILAVSGTGTAILFKKTIIPRLKSWIRKVVLEEEAAEEGISLKPSLAEEAAIAAKTAAAAATDVARASQEMLASKTEEKKYFKELTDLLNYQVQEMKSMTSAIQRLEGSNRRPPLSEQDNRKISVSSSQQFYANGKVDTDARSVRSLSPPTSQEPSGPPHPKSYMDIMEMVQRGERPPNIRDINDQPPNPNQPISEPALAPKPKPWEAIQTQNSSSNFIQSQGSGDVPSYGYQDNNQFNGSSSTSTPWWQRKNARVTEIESEDEQRFGSSGIPTNEQRAPPRSSWVPPQPPPVVMAEAAAAIRQPKKSLLQKDQQLTDDQLLGHNTSEISDDLQRITKISESGGGVAEANGDGMTQTSLADGVPTLE